MITLLWRFTQEGNSLWRRRRVVVAIFGWINKTPRQSARGKKWVDVDKSRDDLLKSFGL